MFEFSSFNQILLSLFYNSNAFQDSFLTKIKVKMRQTI